MLLKNKVSLRINLAPGDYPHAKHILKHQLDILSNQVDEIILTVDTRQSKGKFAKVWDANKDLLNQFLSVLVLSLMIYVPLSGGHWTGLCGKRIYCSLKKLTS